MVLCIQQQTHVYKNVRRFFVFRNFATSSKVNSCRSEKSWTEPCWSRLGRWCTSIGWRNPGMRLLDRWRLRRPDGGDRGRWGRTTPNQRRRTSRFSRDTSKTIYDSARPDVTVSSVHHSQTLQFWFLTKFNKIATPRINSRWHVDKEAIWLIEGPTCLGVSHPAEM